jgi:hypothetical protein
MNGARGHAPRPASGRTAVRSYAPHGSLSAPPSAYHLQSGKGSYLDLCIPLQNLRSMSLFNRHPGLDQRREHDLVVHECLQQPP